MKDIKISKKHIFLSVISVLMVLIMICFSGCNKNQGSSESESSHNPIVITPGNSSGEDSDDTPKIELPVRTDEVNSAIKNNDDVVGWLYIPGLTDVDRGVCHDASSYSYDRRDITGKKLGGIGSGKEYWV